MAIKILTAVDCDGFKLGLLTMVFEVPDEKFDLVGTIRKAVTDYCRTEEGRKVYEYNCRRFNLENVKVSFPKERFEKYGIRYVDSFLTDGGDVEWDEQFVDDLDDEDEDENE